MKVRKGLWKKITWRDLEVREGCSLGFQAKNLHPPINTEFHKPSSSQRCKNKKNLENIIVNASKEQSFCRILSNFSSSCLQVRSGHTCEGIRKCDKTHDLLQRCYSPKGWCKRLLVFTSSIHELLNAALWSQQEGNTSMGRSLMVVCLCNVNVWASSTEYKGFGIYYFNKSIILWGSCLSF